ncbi:MAG: tyrosine--tRNA ligase [Epsilonproteobacteria bacterium]|nr:tyrosine--tRNA ligase [Campylobacterota bacterium]NPA57283.1 tyrosine--tRNA ligase [Campylobacterota bacterium]
MVREALEEIRRGSVEIIDEERIEELLRAYFEEGREYRVKAGFDPTAPDLHLGHTVLLQKLATFQKYGGIVQFIIGDFTAMIGDPTGKSETRKKLDRETVLQNAKSYGEQVFKVLDPERTEVLFNSQWLEALGASGLLELTTLFSVARMLERDDFEKRFKAQQPIAISEFIYPLLQGYDSVHLRSDIEIGGRDQKFNLLMGRHLQRSFGVGKEQAILMMPLLEGLDGVQKMSKSLGNYIGVTEPPETMYAKLLSISDQLMWRYYELLSSRSLEEIGQMRREVEEGRLHPKRAKELLALEIVERYHGREEALRAKEEFDRVHKERKLPSDLREFSLEGPIWIAKALVATGLEPSTSQARRDIQGGAVRIDGEKVTDRDLHLERGEYILQVGKRKFAKLKVE